jgi:hypothetical protein
MRARTLETGNAVVLAAVAVPARQLVIMIGGVGEGGGMRDDGCNCEGKGRSSDARRAMPGPWCSGSGPSLPTLSTLRISTGKWGP